MVVERTFLDPARVARFVVRCHHCTGEIALPIDTELRVPPKCPHCPGTWEADGVNAFIDAMRVFTAQQRPTPVIGNGPAIHLSFEINGQP